VFIKRARMSAVSERIRIRKADCASEVFSLVKPSKAVWLPGRPAI